MWERARRAAARRLKLLAACAALGGFYGAVYGAVLGGFGGIGSALEGGLLGAALGAVGGGATGAVLILVGNGLGWERAALFGGLVPGLLLINLAASLARLDSAHLPGWILAAVVGGLLPTLIAASLGIAVGRALRTGRSAVPGVPHLVEAVNELRGLPRSGSRSESSAEVIPACAPTGRGNEAAPSIATVPARHDTSYCARLISRALRYGALLSREQTCAAPSYVAQISGAPWAKTEGISLPLPWKVPTCTARICELPATTPTRAGPGASILNGGAPF